MSSAMTSLPSLLALALIGRQASAYTWPNAQMEALDALRYEQTGTAGQDTAGFVFPCNQFFRGTDEGRINSADWLRTAYHDMATHDGTAGMGGLDASIQFQAEQVRPENAGDSFSNTLGIVVAFTGTHVSLADAIALGAIVAVESCGGDYIAFRGGRVDATQAGPPGVPEPQDTLAQHTADFARQGFTAQEMIQLVACGHSLGGVQNNAFPFTAQTPGTTNNTSGNEFFDTTFAIFDNAIATDYISGKSIDPLIVGPNVTTRSDARIFASDGNATMRAFASSNTYYKATCAVLFERMLNTVPSSVKLTEEVLPLPAKPDNFILSRNLNGTLTVSTSVRLWNMQEDPSRAVNFVWAGSNGQPRGSCAMTHDPEAGSSIFIPGNITSLFYALPGVSIFGSSDETARGLLLGGDAAMFWFEVTEQGNKTVFDQNGAKFQLGETTVLPAEGSCLLTVIHDDGINFSETQALFVQIGVVKGTNPSSVSVELISFLPNNNTAVPAVLNKTASASNPHIDVWSVNVTDQNMLVSIESFQVLAKVGSSSVSQAYSNINVVDLPACSGSTTSFGPKQGAQGPAQTVGGPAQTSQRPVHNVPIPPGGLRGVFLRLLRMQK